MQLWHEGPGSLVCKRERDKSTPAQQTEHHCPHLQSRAYLGMSTLGDLIFKRPSRQFQYLHVLLDLSSHEKDRVSLCL